MKRVAFKLKLRPGCLKEYCRRHDEIWPEMEAINRAAGIEDFRIWHDPETDILFCSQLRDSDERVAASRHENVWLKWQGEMAEFLVTGENGLPLNTPLDQVYYMP